MHIVFFKLYLMVKMAGQGYMATNARSWRYLFRFILFNLRLKEAIDGASTTSLGSSFQMLMHRHENILHNVLVLKTGLIILKSFPLVK